MNEIENSKTNDIRKFIIHGISFYKEDPVYGVALVISIVSLIVAIVK